MSSNLQIAQVILPETTDLNPDGIKTKEQLFDHMINMLDTAGKLNSKEGYLASIYERENMGPTFMENFIAIPHGKSDAVAEPGIAFCRCDDGLQYDTPMGGGIAKLIFMLAIPSKMTGKEYMGVLARLARLLVHEEFLDALYAAKSYEDVTKAISEGEALLEK